MASIAELKSRLNRIEKEFNPSGGTLLLFEGDHVPPGCEHSKIIWFYPEDREFE